VTGLSGTGISPDCSSQVKLCHAGPAGGVTVGPEFAGLGVGPRLTDHFTVKLTPRFGSGCCGQPDCNGRLTRMLPRLSGFTTVTGPGRHE
jgi:hypothetical protein